MLTKLTIEELLDVIFDHELDYVDNQKIENEEDCPIVWEACHGPCEIKTDIRGARSTEKLMNKTLIFINELCADEILCGHLKRKQERIGKERNKLIGEYEVHTTHPYDVFVFGYNKKQAKKNLIKIAKFLNQEAMI